MVSPSVFREKLLAWSEAHPRPLPWKGVRDPYLIWLSEIILQQTRVEQGLPYFEKFAAQYPTVRQLADAPEEELFKLWEGLGYYSRARNLHATAKYIANDLNGRFPDTYEGIRALKGVGDYTAAAIASFAYRLPHAVVDGNVYRVLSRIFGIETPIDTPAGKREFTALATRLLDPAAPDAFNQAMMDFGATHCLPRLPKCSQCPFSTECVARTAGRVAVLPVKSKTLQRRDRFFLYLVFKSGDRTLVRRREDKDIWQNLWEFPLLELPALPDGRAEAERLIDERFFPQGRPAGMQIVRTSQPMRQTLTHQQISAIFCEIDLPESLQSLVKEQVECPEGQWELFQNLIKNMAFPRIIDWYLREKTVTYSLF